MLIGRSGGRSLVTRTRFASALTARGHRGERLRRFGARVAIILAMRTDPRPRHYVSPGALAVMRPILRFSQGRDAYVLRLAGNRAGPVLRRERRGRGGRYREELYLGPDRRNQLPQIVRELRRLDRLAR